MRLAVDKDFLVQQQTQVDGVGHQAVEEVRVHQGLADRHSKEALVVVVQVGLTVLVSLLVVQVTLAGEFLVEPAVVAL